MKNMQFGYFQQIADAIEYIQDEKTRKDMREKNWDMEEPDYGWTVCTRLSGFTGELNSMLLPVDKIRIEDWRTGNDKRQAQDAFPELDADLRDFLMTGVTPEEWGKYLP